MELDTQFIGGPSEGHAAGGGRAWQGGAAEEIIRAEGLLGGRVAQGGKPLATVDALIRQGAVE